MARTETAQPYLSLDRYRRLMNIPFCLFNGVDGSGEAVSGCDHCWSQWEREMVAQALYDAEETLARHLGFYLGSRFLTDTDRSWTSPMELNWGYIIGGGIEGLTDVSADVSASDFTTDPATITIPQASFSSQDEIYIVETSSGLQVIPNITTVGANYLIEIDQCLLIEWDNLEDQTEATCIEYDALFPAATWIKLADLTIYRRYLDDTDQATITYGPSCNCWIAGSACAGLEYDGCVYVIDEQISKVRVSISTYDEDTGTWTCTYPTLCGCYSGDKVKVNYRAGTTVPGWERAVMSLAHTYMVLEPCGCAMFDLVLKRDRGVPTVLTAERINCPLGQMDGAWWAWQWLQTHAHRRAFML